MKISQPSLIVSIVLIVAIAAGGYFIVKHNSKKDEEQKPTPMVAQEQPDQLIDKSFLNEVTYKVLDKYTTEVSYKTPDKYATFDVVYPQFKNTETKFNKKIEDFVAERIMEHKKVSAENWQGWKNSTRRPFGDERGELPKDEEKFPLAISWKAIQINSQFISFIFVISGYTGGNHGYVERASFNYDVASKKEVTLADLFPADPNYLKTISDFSRKDLQAQFRKKLDIKIQEDEKNFLENGMPGILRGTEPDEENFSIFTFTSDSVTFYFAQYQVAAYAMGMFEVTMSRK